MRASKSLTGNRTTSARMVPASIWFMSSSAFSMPDMAAHRIIEPCDQILRLFAFDDLRQLPLKQSKRLQGLTQVMTGGGEKA